MDLKNCVSCNLELPKDLDHFFKRNADKDGLTKKCKVCLGKKYTKKLSVIDGHKFCKKCDRQLPVDNRFFPVDPMCADGLRNICRECGKDKHFMIEGFIAKQWWTEENEILFIDVYPNYTNEELIDKYFPNESIKSLADKAFKMGKINKSEDIRKRTYKETGIKMSGANSYMFGKVMSDETKRKLSFSKKGKYTGVNNKLFGISKSDEHRKKMSIAFKRIKKWSGDNNPRHIKPLYGDLNGRWLGGLKSENDKARSSEEYKEWRILVFTRDNFTCQCCGFGEGTLEAHHILNFSTNETIRFDVSNGLTMCKKCHNPNEYGSFHYTYGTRNNNLEQLEEYIKRWKSGEFEEVS